MQITIWNEHIHERRNPEVKAVYPDGIHGCLMQALAERIDARFVAATLEDEEHGLPGPVLDATDVLFWWGHLAHDQVTDAVVERVHERVLAGMGLVVLHSAHLSRIFRRLMGTTCNLRWREADDRELLWTVNPQHPISRGVAQPVELTAHEMYGEFFDIPQPDELVFAAMIQGFGSRLLLEDALDMWNMAREFFGQVV